MANSNQDIGEEALSTAAETAMSTQLDEQEDLDVDIHTDPGKVVQGELDAVEIEGEGLVMNKDLRTEKLELKTDNISINPLKAAFGDIELERPTDASAHIVLTEQDMERAFNSEYIQAQFKNLKIDFEGQSTTIDPNNIRFRLPGNTIALSSDVRLNQIGETKQVAFTAVPTIETGGYRVTLENVQYEGGEEISSELTNALIESAQELLDLRNFELEGMSLRFQNIAIQTGKLMLEAKACIEEFPSE